MTRNLRAGRDFWTVRNRLICGYAIEILITVLLGGYALTRLLAIQSDSLLVSRQTLPGIVHVSSMDSQAARIQSLVSRLATTPDAAEAERVGRDVVATLDSMNRTAGQLESTSAAPQERAAFQAFLNAKMEYAGSVSAFLASMNNTPAQRSELIGRLLDPTYKRLRETLQVAAELKFAAAQSAGTTIQTAVSRAEAMIITGLCASILIVGISCYFIVRAINIPLTRLAWAMDQIRNGDFTVRLETKRRDEFGELADGFNQMSDSLSDLVRKVQESGIVVNSSSSQLAGTARQQEGSAQDTAATTVQIGATAKEISATSQELVKTVKEVAQVAEQTTSMAGNGQSGLLRMQETMVQVMTAASAISGKLTVLNDKAGSISQVVTTIAKVADQTNLLSLNAAIEAEKAGEYGRGFSVVATEIRRLADQTAVASHDIEQTVKEMQTAVSAGVMSVDRFSEEVRRGVQEVNQVGAQLNEIIEHVQALTPRFESVNEGMQMHAVGAQQISASLAQLGESTQQTVASLRQSNITLERLNEASQALRSAVSRFKLHGAAPVAGHVVSVAESGVRRSADAPSPTGTLDF